MPTILTSSPRPAAGLLPLLLVAAALLIPATHASADSIKRGDLPTVDGITIIGVEEGELIYRTAAGERRAPLSEIKELTIESSPAFGTGLKAFQEGQLRTAQRELSSVWQNSRVDWVKHYAGYYLLQVYDQRKDAVPAGEVFAQLAADGADLFFLSKPPSASLAEADDDQKERIQAQIMAVIQRTNGERREKLRNYLNAVAGGEVDLPQNQEEKDQARGNARRADSAVILPEAVWKVVERPREPEGKWDAVKLMSEGKQKEAVEKLKPMLSTPGDLPIKLFLMGRAQLALADAAEDDEKLYMDAGLTFMRLVVHFSREGQSHPLVAPARLEVAYIHKMIGREDIYNTMLFGGESGGGVNLIIDDAEVYPQYRKRYYQIIGEDPPAE